MADHIVSVDAGNGGTNAVLAQKRGRYLRYYFPSVRAAATGDSLGLGAEMELQYSYVDWSGHRYVVGDDVLRVTRRNLERHQGSARYGNEFQQFLVNYALARLGIKEGTVDLTLFAPPGLYNEVKEAMRQRFLALDGHTAIQLKGDPQPRKWQYESVTVWPEGIGAVACFTLNANGDPISTDLLDGDVVVLDMGVFTLDAVKLTDGNFNAESLEFATWDNGGINIHLREPILRVVKKQSPEFANVTVDDIDQVIRRGLEHGDYTLRIAGLEVELATIIDKYRTRYAEWIANNIGDGVFNGFKGIKSVILVGGGAALVGDHLREWFGAKVLDPRDHDATKDIHPVDMNAVGGLRLALMRNKKAKSS